MGVEPSWENVCGRLKLPLKEISDLAEKDPLRCLERVENAARQRGEVLDVEIQSLERSPHTGKVLGETLEAFRLKVTPRMEPAFVEAVDATYRMEKQKDRLLELLNAIAAWGDAVLLMKPRLYDKIEKNKDVPVIEKEVEESSPEDEKLAKTEEAKKRLLDMGGEKNVLPASADGVDGAL